jgi:hypothetical protein
MLCSLLEANAEPTFFNLLHVSGRVPRLMIVIQNCGFVLGKERGRERRGRDQIGWNFD